MVGRYVPDFLVEMVEIIASGYQSQTVKPNSTIKNELTEVRLSTTEIKL